MGTWTESMLVAHSCPTLCDPMDCSLLVHGYILSPCLFNLHAEYIMRNAGREEAQAGLRYADDTTLTVESEEKLKSLLMKVKEESENVVPVADSFRCLAKLIQYCKIFK